MGKIKVAVYYEDLRACYPGAGERIYDISEKEIDMHSRAGNYESMEAAAEAAAYDKFMDEIDSEVGVDTDTDGRALFFSAYRRAIPVPIR